MASEETDWRLENMLFERHTVYANDYMNYFPYYSGPCKVDIRKKKVPAKREDPVYKHNEMLVKYRSLIPFDSIWNWKPKDIVRTRPSDVQRPYEEPKDEHHDEVVRSRPRLVMTPAVSVDDIADLKTRELLVKSTYTSTAMASYSLVGIDPGNKAPLGDKPAYAKPIFLPKLKPPKVPREWRMGTLTWDRNQLRSHADVTKEFWIATQPATCTPCKQSAKVKELRRTGQLS